MSIGCITALLAYVIIPLEIVNNNHEDEERKKYTRINTYLGWQEMPPNYNTVAQQDDNHILMISDIIHERAQEQRHVLRTTIGVCGGCTKHAAQKIRVRIILQGRQFDEFTKKAMTGRR